MISFREAQDIVAAKAKNFGSEFISLEDADGRILAEDIFADRDYPPFNRSAMDGYAFRFDDWEKGIRNYQLQEIIFAGMVPAESLKSGACFKIMTGAPVPPSADVVIRREDSAESAGKVSFNIDKANQFQNIAKQGEDLQKGQVAIKAYSVCTPAVVSTLAALGKTRIKVNSLPKVAFFTTGNEVLPISSNVNPVQIRNSNEWLVKSLLKQWQIKPDLYKHIPDNPEELELYIRQALQYDVLIMSGGVSAGDADYVPQVLESLSVKKLFHKVAIKPGKPIWCGEMPSGGLVFALPGNPFSTMVTFKLFIENYLSNSLNTPALSQISLPFSGNRVKKTNLDEFFPVQLKGRPLQAKAVNINGSGDIRLGLYADAIAHHPKDNVELTEGTLLDCYGLL